MKNVDKYAEFTVFHHLPDHAGMRAHEFVKNIVVAFGTEVTFDFRSLLNQNNSYMVKFFFWGYVCTKPIILIIAWYEIITTNSALRTRLLRYLSFHTQRAHIE